MFVFGPVYEIGCGRMYKLPGSLKVTRCDEWLRKAIQPNAPQSTMTCCQRPPPPAAGCQHHQPVCQCRQRTASPTTSLLPSSSLNSWLPTSSSASCLSSFTSVWFAGMPLAIARFWSALYGVRADIVVCVLPAQ